MIEGPDRINVKVVATSDDDEHDDEHEQLSLIDFYVSGSYSYHQMQNGRKVYKVSFIKKKLSCSQHI